MNNVVHVGAIALQGVQGAKVTIEAGISRQLPGIAIVGLPDTALTEAKQRVRHAAGSLGLQLTDRFILVNLQPAELPKYGSGFDLAIALGVLAVSGTVPATGMADTVHIGELSLDGSLIRPRGLLPAVIAAKELGYSRAIVPVVGLREAAMVTGIEVIGAATLQGAVNWYRGTSGGWIRGDSISLSAGALIHQNELVGDIKDVIGQPLAIKALTIAAVGKHHVHLVGPPGAGKTMLAQRLATLLPDLNDQEALTASSVQALITHEPLEGLLRRPPFQSPHHTASAASIIGSGRAGMILPGTLSLASSGVLFLDEAAEFPRNVLDALRQPLESGRIEIHRAGVRVSLPAAIQLVLAQNPCPCGKAGTTSDDSLCSCTPMQRRRYMSRLSGPLKDRMDVRLTVQRVQRANSGMDASDRATSSQIRARVSKARGAARERLDGTGWDVNADVPGVWLRTGKMKLPHSTTIVIDRALELGTLTLRGYDRLLRVAWSISDLNGKIVPGRDDVAEALMLRENT